MSNDYFRMKFWALLLVLSSCTKPNPASCLDDFCSDPALPFCDVDGSIGGTPDTCIAVECTAGEFQGCRDNNALICSETGNNIDEIACEFGCNENGCLPCNTPECQPAEPRITPKYLPTVCNEVATTDLTVSSDFTIDTSDDANCTIVVPQTSAPEICVIRHQKITIAENQTLTVSGDRAIALVADRDLDVSGILDASANGTFNGPGGGFKKSGSGGSLPGGGAGQRTQGGNGGNDNTTGGSPNGGAPEIHPALLAELVGGTQPAQVAPGQLPGGGGGAVTLVSCRGTLSVVGVINAGGGGGLGGRNPLGGVAPPGGGGAGGVIVLQGLSLSVTGQIFANGGGGGGGGNVVIAEQGGAGEDGLLSTACAKGGVSIAGFGGSGGCLQNAPGNGRGDGTAGGGQLAGAGGGSTGFILTYTPEGVVPMLDPLAVSPGFEPNGVLDTN